MNNKFLAYRLDILTECLYNLCMNKEENYFSLPLQVPLAYFTTDGLVQGLEFFTYHAAFMEAYIDSPDEFDDTVFGSI